MVLRRLLPREIRFFDYFELSAQTMHQAALALVDLLDHTEEMAERLKRIEDLEHDGDQTMHEVMTALNQTFVLPLEREDITALIASIDDVTDGIWAAATRLDIYSIEAPTDISRRMAQVLVRQSEALGRALPLLRRRQDMGGIAENTEEVGRLEHDADELYREGLRSLFAHPADSEDVVLSIKWRDIYERLEIATDRAKHAGQILNGVVLKHA